VLPRWRRPLLAALLLAAGTALALAAAHRFGGPPAPLASDGPPLVSLLAVGDIGTYRADLHFLDAEWAVGAGMAAEDRRQPVTALVFLGDNFYPRGLTTAELVQRIRRNLVGPFCRFADLRGPRSREAESACPLPPAERHPVPLYAVLGNHDRGSPESPDLERRAIPEFLSNWSMPDGAVDVVELPGGVSLVLFDSTQRGSEEATAHLARAIARARGPWRILAMHHPIAPHEASARPARHLPAPALRALEEAGVPVQMLLAGHDHSLQIVQADPPGALQVIAGGGSSQRPLREPPYANRRFALVSTGFARIDAYGQGAAQRLEVSLFSVRRYPLFLPIEPRLVSRWQVDLEGRAHPSSPPPNS
jgi:3',5'-cyclic AMP phosphodiesterase CpdA